MASSVLVAGNASKLLNEEFEFFGKFAATFVLEFEDKYLQYFEESCYKTEKLTSTFTSTTAAVSVGVATTSSCATGTRVDPAPIYRVLTSFLKRFDPHRSDAVKTIDAINVNPKIFKESNAFRKILMKAGIEIAKSFEYQFLNIIPPKLRFSKSITLAQHAVNRIMNHIKKEKNNLDELEKISVSYLTKGLIKGKPKGYVGNLIPKVDLENRSLEFEQQFFDYPGIVTPRKCFVKSKYEKKMKTFGCRICFDWESESDFFSRYTHVKWNYEKKIEMSDVGNLLNWVNEQLDDSDLPTLANSTRDKQSKILDLVQETNKFLVKELKPVLQDTNGKVQDIKKEVGKISEYVSQEEKKKQDEYKQRWNKAKEEMDEEEMDEAETDRDIVYFLAEAISLFPGIKISNTFIRNLNVVDKGGNYVHQRRIERCLKILHNNEIIKYAKKAKISTVTIYTIFMENEMAAVIRPNLDLDQGTFCPPEVLIKVLESIETLLRHNQCSERWLSAVYELLKKYATLGIDLAKYSSLFILLIKELKKYRCRYKECIELCLILENRLIRQDKKLDDEFLLLIIRFHRGECHLKLSELEKAKEIFAELKLKLLDQCCVNGRKRERILEILTITLECLEEKNEGRAKNGLKLLSELDAKNAIAKDTFAIFCTYFQYGDYKATFIKLNEADIDPELKARALNMGICYMKLKDLEEAIEVFETKRLKYIQSQST